MNFRCVRRRQKKDLPTSPVSRPISRGEPRCTFVTEIIGLPLALSVFPEVYDFPGDAVLGLVEPGLYKKHWRSQSGSAYAFTPQ